MNSWRRRKWRISEIKGDQNERNTKESNTREASGNGSEKKI